MKKLLQNDLISYLFFGILATAVYLTTRILVFEGLANALIATMIANVTAIIFAFFTNDRFVFRQQGQGWPGRFIKFFMARLATLFIDFLLTFIFVTTYPQLIGQVVNNNLQLVNTIVALFSQILIIIGNYVISKFLIFTNQSSSK